MQASGVPCGLSPCTGHSGVDLHVTPLPSICHDHGQGTTCTPSGPRCQTLPCAYLYSRCQKESCLVTCHSALNLFSMAVCADAAAAAASAAASDAERALKGFRLGWLSMVGAAWSTAGRLLWLNSRGRTAEPVTARTTRRTAPSSRCRPALRLPYVASCGLTVEASFGPGLSSCRAALAGAGAGAGASWLCWQVGQGLLAALRSESTCESHAA